jgi:hypothetical protein
MPLLLRNGAERATITNNAIQHHRATTLTHSMLVLLSKLWQII